MLPAQPNNSLLMGFECFQQIAGSSTPLGPREVGRRLGISATRASRILGTLAHIGMVKKTAQHKYQAGPGVHVLAAQSLKASGLLPAALPLLLPFRQEGLTIALGVCWDGRVSYLFHERPWQGFEESIGVHDTYPAEYSSLGIAWLAAQPGKVTRPVLREDDNPGKLLPGQEFQASIREARHLGYAVRLYASGETSIGVTIGHPAFAGIAISGPHLGRDAVPALAARLTEAAAQIEERLPQV